MHRRPFLNTPEFFDKSIFLLTKAYDNHYTPIIKVNKIRRNQFNPIYSDFEITIKISTAELQIYRDIMVAENRFIKDNPKNLDYFPDQNTIKIRSFLGNMVLNDEKISPYDEVALRKNKKQFNKFLIDNEQANLPNI